jgi:hypothetical protein
MINIEEVRSISDRYFFMINNERIKVNKDDINRVWEMVNNLIKKYESFATITQRILKNKGW